MNKLEIQNNSLKLFEDKKMRKRDSSFDNKWGTICTPIKMLAEVTTTEISKAEKPFGFEESKNIAIRGGGVAKIARENIERQTGKSVISSQNSKSINLLESKEGDLDEE